jgi:hypothetical protein
VSGLSKHLGGALLGASLKGTSFTGSAPLYLALLEQQATADDDGTTLALKEVGYQGYARAAVASNVWGTVANNRVANVNAIPLAICSGGSATVNYWALCTAATAGQVYWMGAVTPFVIDTGDPAPSIPSGMLVVVFG